MEAGIVLTTPQPSPSTAAEVSPDVTREDAEAFAAHLPQETKAQPSQRKPPATGKDDATTEEDETCVTPTPAPSFSLTSPVAPVLVREDGAPAVQEIALTPVTPGPQPRDAGAIVPTPTLPNDAQAKGVKPDVAPVSAQTPPATATPQAATADTSGATPVSLPEAALATDAATPFVLPTAESLAAAGATPAKPATAEPNTESLRAAGRPRGAKAEAAATAEAKSPVTAAAATAQAGARPDAKPEFIAASTSNTTPTASSDSTTPAIGDPPAVTLEARRAAEAQPTTSVHRPPTVAATVAQHIIRKFDGKSTTIDVRLDPAELGKVSVKLEVGPDSRVTAVVAADNPATLSDLMRSSRELERALESAGLELTQGGLSFDLSDRSNNSSAQANDAGGGSGLRAGNDNAAAADVAAPASRPFGLESWRGVRVDVTV